MSKVKIEGHGTGTGTFTLTTPSSNTDRTITLPDGTGTLAFTTGDDDKLPLAGGTLTGNLLVQSASTGATASTDADDLVIEGTNGGISILNATNGQGNIFFGDSGDNDIGKIAYNHTANTMYFITNGGVRTSLTPDGLTFNGDTAAANALNDYEEGTWTGTFAVSSGSVVTNNSNNTGRYTRIGRSVHVQGVMVTASHSSPSGTLTLSGLPFACGADTDLSEEVYFYIGVNNIANNNGATNQPLMGYLGGGSQTITIYTSDGNNLGGAGNRVNNNGYFGFSFTYSV